MTIHDTITTDAVNTHGTNREQTLNTHDRFPTRSRSIHHSSYARMRVGADLDLDHKNLVVVLRESAASARPSRSQR